MSKINEKSLEKVAVELRTTLQQCLREKVKTKADREKLAKLLKRSRSHIESMLYEGKGGLDSWVKAFAVCFDLKAEAIKNLSLNLRTIQALTIDTALLDQADEMWMKLKIELKASPADRYYYAQVAFTAMHIKREIELIKSRSKYR